MDNEKANPNPESDEPYGGVVVVGARVRVLKVEVESGKHTGARVRIGVGFLKASAEDKRVRIMIRGAGVVRVLVARERGSATMMRVGM